MRKSLDVIRIGRRLPGVVYPDRLLESIVTKMKVRLEGIDASAALPLEEQDTARQSKYGQVVGEALTTRDTDLPALPYLFAELEDPVRLFTSKAAHIHHPARLH
ncbi:hypothetical protein PsYK624_024780 [Phanerochaete sordida]|uniref:Uncharacterized protein n=1 Tax=Phanerochaete sordida TaxID=48140 RepID=A0A9P3L9W9_9APHY|nr:hypothetical protein PsYK624_024780 [Phanerochaete sordida]